MDAESPLYRAAAQGTFTPAAARRYLASVRYLIGQTVPHLRRARDVACARQARELAEHFSQKLAEEDGHERWAEADLAALRERFGGDPADVSPPMRALVAYLEWTIDRDPRLYLAYILFAEYLIALRADDWLDLLESRCGIPKSTMTVIAHHAELDRHHAREGIDAIDTLVTDAELEGPMQEVLATVLQYFQRFSADVVEEARPCRQSAAS